MKIRRYKKVSKTINFYVNNFRFRQPFQILIDGTFCYGALNNKINIEDNIPRYLQAELKFLTTACVVIETENLGRKVSGASFVLKKFPVHKCGHEKRPIPGADCLSSMIGKNNPNHYIIASQDCDLQKKLRLIPGVPLLYLHQKTPVLEQPSLVTVEVARKMMTFVGDNEVETIHELKQKHGISDIEEKPKRKKRKRGPNPLSCKKKKKTNAVLNNNIKKKEGGEIGKKQRKKIRIPKHVKEELLNAAKR